jgi:hypothetical protein
MALLNTATGWVFIVEFLGVHSFEDFVTPCSLVGFPPTRRHDVTRQMFCSLLLSPSTCLTSQQFSRFSKQHSLTDQALLIHCSVHYYYYHHPLALLRSSSAGSHHSTVSLTKHFLFTFLPKTSNCTACIQYYCFLHWNIQSVEEIKQFQSVVQFRWDNTVCG